MVEMDVKKAAQVLGKRGAMAVKRKLNRLDELDQFMTRHPEVFRVFLDEQVILDKEKASCSSNR